MLSDADDAPKRCGWRRRRARRDAAPPTPLDLSSRRSTARCLLSCFLSRRFSPISNRRRCRCCSCLSLACAPPGVLSGQCEWRRGAGRLSFGALTIFLHSVQHASRVAASAWCWSLTVLWRLTAAACVLCVRCCVATRRCVRARVLARVCDRIARYIQPVFAVCCIFAASFEVRNGGRRRALVA